MIINLLVNSYKSYQKATVINLDRGSKAPYSIIYGLNGVGKSAILEVLDFLFNYSNDGITWNNNKTRKNYDSSYVLGIFKCNKEAFIKYISEKERREKFEEIKEYVSLVNDFIEQQIKSEESSKNPLFDVPYEHDPTYAYFMAYRNHEGNLETSNSYTMKMKRYVKDHLELNIFDEEILKKYIGYVISYHVYVYVPAESIPPKLLNLTNINFQRLMDQSLLQGINEILTKKGLHSAKRSLLDELNNSLSIYINNINKKLSFEQRRYTFKTPPRGRQNITVNDLTNKIVSSYFNKRKLFMLSDDGINSTPIEYLSSGEQKQAIINTFYAILLNKNINDNADYIIWGIDEPENSQDYTHVLPQFERLEKLSTERNIQILITTHWYGILPISSNGTAIEIEPSEQKKSIAIDKFYTEHSKDEFGIKSIYDLATSIISYLQTYPDKNIIICEGTSDKTYLECYLNVDKVKIIPVAGKGNVQTVFSLLRVSLKEFIRNNDISIVCIVDTDPIFEDMFNYSKDKKICLMRWQNISSDTNIVNLVNVFQKGQQLSSTAIEDILNPRIFFKALCSLMKEYQVSTEHINLNEKAKVSNLMSVENTELSCLVYSGSDFQDEISAIRELIKHHKGQLSELYSKIYKAEITDNSLEPLSICLKELFKDDEVIYHKPHKTIKDESNIPITIMGDNEEVFSCFKTTTGFIIPRGTRITPSLPSLPNSIRNDISSFEMENEIDDYVVKKDITYNKDLRSLIMLLIGRLIYASSIDKYVK